MIYGSRGSVGRYWLFPLCFLVVFGAANFISYFAFGHTPHISDSASYVFQARTFSRGLLYAPVPQPPMFFKGGQTIMTNEKWYSIYPPGHALMLAPWAAAGIPWALNPLLGALSVILMYFYGKSCYGKNIGVLSMILAAFSPLVIFMSSEYMSHATSMFYALIFAVLFRKAISSGNAATYALSGLALGFVILTRPYTGLALSIPFVARLLFSVVKRKPLSLGGAAAFFSLLTVAGLILMSYNAATNGSPLKFGYDALEWAEVAKLGFGARGEGGSLDFTFSDGIAHIPVFVGLFNKQLFGWPIPDLIPAALLLLMFRKIRQEDFFQLSIVIFVVGAHVFYWYIDDVFGPRLVYETAPALIVLTARGLVEAVALLKEKWHLHFRNSIVPFAASVGVVAFFVIFSLFRTFPSLYDKYSHNYIGAKCTLCSAIRRENIHNAVVLIRSNNVRFVSNMILYHNSPLLDDDVVFARNQDEQNFLLMQPFRDKSFYRYEAYFTGTWARSQVVYEKLTKL